MYRPSDSLRAGRKAVSSNCTIVTKLAITTIKHGIRTVSGIIFLNNEINKLEHTSTAIVERPIPIPFIALVVTASVGHVPRTCIKVGFSSIIPFLIALRALLIS